MQTNDNWRFINPRFYSASVFPRNVKLARDISSIRKKKEEEGRKINIRAENRLIERLFKTVLDLSNTRV